MIFLMSVVEIVETYFEFTVSGPLDNSSLGRRLEHRIFLRSQILGECKDMGAESSNQIA